MLVRETKAAARRWVMEVGRHTPGFAGAYIAGSANWFDDDVEYPRTSDLDTAVVLEGQGDTPKLGKFIYEGALLEVSYFDIETLRPVEAVLGSAVLAGGFRTPSIILDPTGELTALHEVVSREFARRSWVRTRCERIAHGPRNWDQALGDAVPLHDQGNACVFGAGVIGVFPLLAAAVKNLTVRKRYVAAREVLAAYGRLDFHEPLLELMGCAAMDRERVERHLGAMTEAFDAAKGVRLKTPYRFASDISDAARPISIDGSQELIERGLHREAVFWIFATYARCRHMLADGAPELLARFDPGFMELLGDLGIESLEDRRARGAAIDAFVPRVWEVVDEIMAANPEIVD